MSRNHLISSSLERISCWPIISLAVCLLYGTPLLGQQMMFPGSTWEVATPESVLIDSQKLEAAIEGLDRTTRSVQEMIIVRNGRVIWQGDNVAHSQHVYSVTKTYASVALGLLIDDGKVTIDTRASEHVPALAADFGEATLEHFVTQTSGYAAKDEALPLGAGPRPDDPFAPGQPVFTPPGSQFAYTGASMDMLANALTRAADEPLQDLFTRRIAESIGMDPDQFDWAGFVAEDSVTVDGGSGYGGHGVVVSANNLARLGHLFLNQGRWDQQQLISRDWVESSTQLQVPHSTPLHPLSAVGGPGQYGYGWWVNGNWFRALGFNENWILAHPEAGIVIGRLGTDTSAQRETFESRILGAVIPAVWDQQGDGHWDAFDPATGKPRWQTEQGDVPDIYPTAEAIVRSDTVSVANDLRIGRLTIESGGVIIHEEGSLSSSTRIQADTGASLNVYGRINANRLTIDGSLVIDGAADVKSLSMDQATVSVVPGAKLDVERLSQTGGVLDIHGDVNVERFRVTDGAVNVHASESPYTITELLELKGDAQLRFVVNDGWTSPISFTGTSAPKLSGTLELDVAATADPKQFEGQTVNLLDWGEGLEPEGQFTEIVSSARTQWDVSQLYQSGEVVLQSVLDKPTEDGDFDGDGILAATDIDQLTRRIRVTSPDNYFDANADGTVSSADLEYWVHELANTYFGDANVDGEFDTKDLVTVFSAGQYEDDIANNSTWSTGDWNGDAEFGSGDLVVAFADGGYEMGRRVAVPEPSSSVVLLLAAFSISVYLRCRKLG